MTNDSTSVGSRRKVWGSLAVLLLLAVGLLALALSSRDDPEEPAAEPGTFRFRVRDDQGRPITHAEVFVLAGDDMPEGGSGQWSDADATLTLPDAVRGSAIAVQARGYRSDVARSVSGDTDFVLKHGFVVRLEIRGMEEKDLGDDVLVFQVSPRPTGDLTQDQLDKIVDLVVLLEPPKEGQIVLGSGTLGFAVRASDAKEGLLIPLAARYGVRWGLFDPKTRAWFSLPEEVHAVIDVTDDARTQLFPIPVTAEGLSKTRKGLRDRIEAVEGR